MFCRLRRYNVRVEGPEGDLIALKPDNLDKAEPPKKDKDKADANQSADEHQDKDKRAANQSADECPAASGG